VSRNGKANPIPVIASAAKRSISGRLAKLHHSKMDCRVAFGSSQ
jgi:hypothetical protein